MTESYKGWFIEPIEQWSQFFQDCNWYTFHLIHIECENEPLTGGWEITLTLLGFGLRFRRNYEEPEWLDQLNEIKQDRPND